MAEGSGEYRMKAETGNYSVTGNEADLMWRSTRGAKFSSMEPPSDWPRGVQPLSPEGTYLFGIDRDTGELYWDGKQIEVRKRLDLTRGERTFAIIVSALTLCIVAFSAWTTWRQAYVAAKALKFEKAKYELALREGRK